MPARVTPLGLSERGKGAFGLRKKAKISRVISLPHAARFDASLPFFLFLGLPSRRLFPKRFRGQGSVEYLFVVVFLVGFIVSVLVPALQTAEISYALAGVRAQAVGYEADHSDLRLLTINSTVLQAEGRVFFNVTVYNRSSDALVAAPQGMTDAMLAGIHRLAPNMGVSASCANTSNYEYCFVS